VYSLVTKDVVNSAILAVRGSKGLAGTGFKTVLIMGDHGQGQDTLQRTAADLNQDWESKGVRVYFIDVAPSAKEFMREYLTKRGVSPDHQTGIDDASEFMSIDPDNQWVRRDLIPATDRKFATIENGKLFVDFKVNNAVKQIRTLTESQKSK
jgi:creatinine amidohydrolase